MSYELRKDVDNLLDNISNLNKAPLLEIKRLKEELNSFYDMSEVDVIAEKLDRDMETLRVHLFELSDMLHEFNGELDDFEQDNNLFKQNLLDFNSQLDIVYGDVTKLKGDALKLRNDLEGFKGDLDDFEDNLDGFDSDLEDLKGTLGGFKDDLEGFENELGDFNNDVDVLNANLNGLTDDLEILTYYLTVFEGDITQLQTKLRTDLGDEEYTKLNTDLIALVGAITNVKKRTTTTEESISTVKTDIKEEIKPGIKKVTDDIDNEVLPRVAVVEDDIDNEIRPGIGIIRKDIDEEILPDLTQVVQDVGDENGGLIKDINDLTSIIGNPNDTGTATLYGNINTSLGHITTIDNYLYGTGTMNNPSQGSIMYRINTIVNTDIPAVENDIDDFNILMYGSKNGDTNHYTTGSLYGRIQSLLTRVNEAESAIGDVNVDMNSDLQAQIKILANIVNGIKPVDVDEIPYYNPDTRPKTSRGNYKASGEFYHDFIHVTTTGKYYVRKYLQ